VTVPLLLYVDTEWRAASIQRQHDPDVVLVRAVGRMHADRAHSIIIETPYHLREGGGTESQNADFQAFMEWVPTRLVPSDTPALTRITRL
jgi:hypothetical protein